MKHHPLLVVLISMVLAACQSQPTAPDEEPAKPVAASPAEKTTSKVAASPAEKAASKQAESSLTAGIKAYENGDYKASQQELQAALAVGLASRDDQVRANKLLAFIACAGKQRDVCKTHFLRAFAINPNFSLSKSEAGHPLWGPVYQEARAAAAKRK